MSAEAPQAEPQVVTLRVHGALEEGVRSRLHIRDFTAVADEPPDLGGGDHGPNPMEYVLGGFISCLTVMIRLVASEQGLTVDGIRFDVEGDLDLRGLHGTAPVRPDFHEVRGTVHLRGPASLEAVTRLRDEVYRRCPAYNMFRNAGISIRLEWLTEVA